MYSFTPATNHAILMRLVGNSMGNQKIGRVARFSTANETKACPFNKERMDHLLKLLKSKSVSSIPSGSMA